MMKEDKQNRQTNESKNVVTDQGMDRLTFLKRSTQLVGAVIGLSLADTLHPLKALAESDSSAQQTNWNKPDLVFPVISDIHIQTSNDQNLKKFAETMDQLNRAAPRQDAFMMVGDLTDDGAIKEYDDLMAVYNAKKQADAVSLCAIGNHDYWNGLSVADAQNLFLEKTGMKSIYFHKVIKGYHFIVLGTEDGTTEGTFTETQIAWLSEKLKLAHEDDSKKPIFVFHHQPIIGTIYGSEWGFTINRDLFYDTLKPYPQVISFSGHTHYPLDDPRIIHQKDFTTIGTSTGAYLWLDAGRIQGEVPEGADVLNQALIVEVHNNKVLIKRRDIHNNDWTGEPFEISFPANKRNFKYTDARKDKQAPFFNRDAMLSVVDDKTTLTGLTVMLTQAKDNLLVHDYKIVAKNAGTGEVSKEYLAFSEFYKDPVPNPLMLNLDGLQPNTTYKIEVHALDAYGNESRESLKALGKTLDGVVKDVTITLSKNELLGVQDTIEVTVENARAPQSDWIGLYEVNEKPGELASIWWMYTQVTDGTCKFTYDPRNIGYPDRYKEGSTYKFVYFYGGGYDAVASTTFTIGSKA